VWASTPETTDGQVAEERQSAALSRGDSDTQDVQRMGLWRHQRLNEARSNERTTPPLGLSRCSATDAYRSLLWGCR
jgi:hypothetical protein